MGEERPTTKTQIDWFMGTVLSVTVEVTPELADMLKTRAHEYLMTRGRLPEWSEWVMLGDASREAFLEAMEDARADKALAGTA